MASVGLFGCRALPTATPAVLRPIALQEDAWVGLGERGADLLARLVQLDTGTPPIREAPAASALVNFLRKEGLDPELINHGMGRASVFLRLKSAAPAGPPLLLVSHLDAEPADEALWRPGAGPYSGADLDGAIWGRGTVDGKALVVVHAMAVVALAQAKSNLPRDVLLVAAAGGQGGEAFGLTQVMDLHPELGSAGLALTEGGATYVDLLGDGRLVHGVANAERGEARIEVAALAGPSGVPAAEDRVVRALERALTPRSRGTLSSAVQSLWTWGVGDQSLALKIAARSEVLTKLFLVEGWGKRALTRGMVQDGLSLERLDVGPDRARGILVARLLPGRSPAQLVAELRAVARDFDVHVQVLSGHEANETPIDPMVLAEIGAALDAPGVVVPILGAQATDGRMLRAIGVPTFGFSPFRIDETILASIEGRDEHLDKAELRAGVRFMAHLIAGLTHSMR